MSERPPRPNSLDTTETSVEGNATKHSALENATIASPLPRPAGPSPLQACQDADGAAPAPGGAREIGACADSAAQNSALDAAHRAAGAREIAAHGAEFPPPPAAADGSGPAMDDDQIFRHSGWATMRDRVRRALFRTGQTGRRVEAFDQCGRNAWVYQDRDSPLQFKVMMDHCRDRLCTPCARERSWKIKTALAAQMGEAAHSFITLTLSGKGEALCDLIDRLYRSFRYLRATELWEKKVKGGAAFLEIKWNHKAARWHPHLHIIADAGFLPQGELSTTWHSITKDSFIVDVRRVSSKAGQVTYVTKYASKPLNTSFAHDPDRLDEAVVALKGRRLCLCFGTWYGTKLSEAEEADLEEDQDDMYRWVNIGSLHELHARANAGERFAIMALTGMGKRHCSPDTSLDDSS